MEAVGSTLDDACDQYVGRTLVVEPQYGWGWVHQEGEPFAENRGVPPSFHLRVLRVYKYRGERRGVLARITEPGFLYEYGLFYFDHLIYLASQSCLEFTDIDTGL